MTGSYSLEERVRDLESDVLQQAHRQAEAQSRLQFLTGALGELSQDARATRLDVKEIRIELAGQGERLGRVEQRLERVEQRLERVEERLDGFDGRFGRIEAQLSAIGSAVTQLLDRLPPREGPA